MIVKKGINQRKRVENQLGLLLNIHNNYKTKQKKKGREVFLCRPLLPCWSVVHHSMAALNRNRSFLCVQLCVCVLGMGVFKMTDLHTNSLSKFTEG